MATLGGPAKSVSVQTGGPKQGGPAIPVAVVSDGRAVEGGFAMPIYVVTSGPVQASPALPIVAAAAGARTRGGPAVPVFVVSGSLNPTPSFSPTDIAGLRWWGKADSLALNDGDPVSSWADSGGSGNPATQGTGANQPLYKTNILNGKPILRFDGTNDRLVTASISHGIGMGDMFWACVIKAPASGDHAIVANGNFVPLFFVNSSHHPDWYLSSDHVFVNSSLAGGTWYTLIVRRFGGTVDCIVNGVADAATFSDSTNIADAVLTIGDEGDNAIFWNSDIAELLFGKTLSNADRDSLTSYLRTKYAHY